LSRGGIRTCNGELANPPLQTVGRVGRPLGSLVRPPLNGYIVAKTRTMRIRASVFGLPVALILLGWAWVALGYRLAFHGVRPVYGFYKGEHGASLERWLFDAPMLFVLLGLAVLALLVGRAWLRQRSKSRAVFFLVECLACACVFAAPVIWFIDVPGRGDIFI
jgi:hypothetical protein